MGEGPDVATNLQVEAPEVGEGQPQLVVFSKGHPSTCWLFPAAAECEPMLSSVAEVAPAAPKQHLHVDVVLRAAIASVAAADPMQKLGQDAAMDVAAKPPKSVSATAHQTIAVQTIAVQMPPTVAIQPVSKYK